MSAIGALFLDVEHISELAYLFSRAHRRALGAGRGLLVCRRDSEASNPMEQLYESGCHNSSTSPRSAAAVTEQGSKLETYI